MVIASDLPLMRKTVWVLESDGFEVLPAETPEKATDMLESAHPDVIIMNTDLSEDAKQVRMEEIRSIVPDACVIDIATRATRASYDTGADGYLDKPFDADDLLTEVRRLLDHQQQQAC